MLFLTKSYFRRYPFYVNSQLLKEQSENFIYVYVNMGDYDRALSIVT